MPGSEDGPQNANSRYSLRQDVRQKDASFERFLLLLHAQIADILVG